MNRTVPSWPATSQRAIEDRTGSRTLPAPSDARTSNTFFAKSCLAYLPGDAVLIRMLSGAGGRPVSVTATSIQRCSGSGKRSS